MKLFIKLFLLGIFYSFSSYGQYIDFTVSPTSSCADGTLTIDINYGTGPYHYEIRNRNTYSYSSGSTSSTHLELTGLDHGDYYITVYGNEGIFSAGSIATISSPFSLSYSKTPVTCNADNGSIVVTPNGGTAPYAYQWSNGSTTQQNENLSSGVYFLTVTDANGCKSVSDSIFLADKSYSIYASSTDHTCHQLGTATVAIYGGSASTYSYYWKTTPVQTTATATGLAPGTYEVVVTDAAGCSKTTNTTVYEGNAFTIDVTGATSEDCNQVNASLSVIASGGTAPYSYLWDNGTTTPHLTNLSGNKYYLMTATDAEGCISKHNFYLSKQSPINVVFSNTPSDCNTLTGSTIAIPNNGTAPYTYLWNTSSTASSLSNLRAGYYSVEVKDANGCTSYAQTFVTENTTCKSIISGTIYNDINGNCIQDNGELGLPYAGLRLSNSSYTYANENGYYSIEVYPGTYNLSVYPREHWTVTCPTGFITVDVAAGGNIYANNNFFITPNSVLSDVSITLYTSPARPGFTRPSYLYYGNRGTQIENATISYTFSEGWDFSSANPMPDTYNGSTRTATWKNTTLNPDYNIPIEIYMSVPTSTTLGTVLLSQATIDIVNTDQNLNNNIASAASIVTNSYDPNDIQVSPQGTGSEGFISEQLDALTYRIRFQNTGTDIAYNVSIKSKIDANLEDYTISILNVSHDVKASIYDDSLRFEFIGINLSDSTSNEAESHGYIIYRVNKKSDLSPLTQILNKADIYFDYNVPVETNEVKNTIASVTPNISELENTDELVFYPNPCRDHAELSINIKTSSNVSVQLYSANGQQISLLDNIALGQGLQVIDLNLAPFNLTTGLYVAKIIANDKVYTKSILINK